MENSMLRIAATIATIGMGATVVYAQNLDAIKSRRDVMKTIATAGVTNFKMMKGDSPFDLAKVQAGLKVYQDEAAKLKGLFPDDSKTGGDTDASPRIWQQRTEFNAAIDTFINGAKAAATAITDEATFKAEYPKVVASCGGCHKDADGFSPRLADSFKKLKQ
jgi:cytochrome c556